MNGGIITLRALLTVGTLLGLLARPELSYGFSADLHERLTVEASRELGFSKTAIKQVVRGNLRTDKDEWTVPHAHFDNEQFSKGASRLRERYALALESAAFGRLSVAREQLGRCLHAIQDFYAHSNFVENHDASETIDLFQLVDPLPEAVCDAKNPRGELSSGYFPKETRPSPWKCTHKELNKDHPVSALHAVALDHAARATRLFFQKFTDELRARIGTTEAENILARLKTEKDKG